MSIPNMIPNISKFLVSYRNSFECMFNIPKNIFAKKQVLSDIFVKEVSPIYTDLAELIKDIDGFIINVYEAGIFIASIASLKIISLDVEYPEKLADEFNDKWLNYIRDSYKVNDEKPDKNLLISRLQRDSQLYGGFFLDIISPTTDEKKKYDVTVALAWTLFQNCTGKKAPISFSKFLLYTAPIKRCAISVFEKIKI